MAVVLSLFDDTKSDADVLETPSTVDEQVRVLAKEFPLICNDVGMMVCRPFRVVWDPTIETASTDCLAEVRLAPWFFLEGERETGYGTVYHETGHIRYSPYGTTLLKEARERGGQVLQHVMNIILDRKDDLLTVVDAPGFADRLRRRLVVIRTLAERKLYAEDVKRLTKAETESFFRHLRPQNVHEDFFYAAKCHKSPRYKQTMRAMKYLTRKKLLAASPDRLLWIAERVVEALGPMESQEASDCLMQLMLTVSHVDQGDPEKPLSPSLQKALQKMVAQYVAVSRTSGIDRLVMRLQQQTVVHPGPLSTGRKAFVPLVKLEPTREDAGRFQRLESLVEPYVTPLVQKLRVLDNPSEFTLYGQDEGELDFSECARIATGLSGYRMETVQERNIDADIHLAVDCSGSMTGEKLHHAKQLAVVFAKAIASLAPACSGYLWAFSSRAIYKIGSVDQPQALMQIHGEDANSDTHMLEHVGAKLARSPHRRRVLLVLGDDGPDDMQLAGQLSARLLSMGIITVHLLVGVHGTPDIYPIELLYTSMEECLEEFGTLIETILKNLK